MAMSEPQAGDLGESGADRAATGVARLDPGVRALVISAPFGNYVRPTGVTPTVGTFTVSPRPGRLWRVIRTVRYSRRMGAWVNRIGLRNPGVGFLERGGADPRGGVGGAIVSVHGFDESDWRALIERASALRPLGLELNVSCPNVGEVTWPGWLFAEAVRVGHDRGVGVVVKVPPVRYESMVRDAIAGGVRWFHCCNTLPVPGGGLSGVPLRALSLRVVAEVKSLAESAGVGAEVRVIGGGGIVGASDVDAYRDAGADRVALGSALMRVGNARVLWSRGYEPRLVGEVKERAEELFAVDAGT